MYIFLSLIPHSAMHHAWDGGGRFSLLSEYIYILSSFVSSIHTFPKDRTASNIYELFSHPLLVSLLLAVR